MKSKNSNFKKFALFTWVLLIGLPGISIADTDQTKATSSGEVTFTVRTVTEGGTYSPKHVLAIWVEDINGFVKTHKAMANQRIQYLYTWKAASNYNVVDAITGPTLTSHQTHTVSWDCTDLDGEIVPDGDYVVWAEFTEKHAQGPLYNITFTKGPDPQTMTPPDETYFKDIELEFIPYIADFIVDETDICQWGTVTFTDNSTNATSWEWDFGEGAAPVTSTSQGPHTVYYTTPGVKTVSLTINGSLTETKENLVTVSPQPEADFTYTGIDLTVNFTNNSTNATTYLWDLGDGNSSTENNPTHTYSEPGNYTVTLTAQYLSCEDLISQGVMVPLVGTYESQAETGLVIFPNPTKGSFFLSTGDTGVPNEVTILDQTGKTVKYFSGFDHYQPGISFNLDDLDGGIYFIKAEFDHKTITCKLILK